MNNRLNNLLFFGRRDASLERRIEESYINGDVAVISCTAREYDDVISRYSVPGCRTLNPELVAYIEENATFIPLEYPIVLEVTGRDFSESEQDEIRSTVEDYFAFVLGKAQQEVRKGRTLFVLMLLCMTVTAVIMDRYTNADIWHELIYLAFWFFADFVYSFILGGGFMNRRNLILAGRLKSMQVRFAENFDDTPYSEKEQREIISNMLEGKN